jgi:hypothetical protein
MSGPLGAKDGWDVLILRVFRCSDFTGITFAFLRRFRELAWIRGGLLCLALSGGRSQATQEGRTRESGHGF